MATVTKTYVFASTLESFTGVPDTDTTTTHDSGNGNPSGSLKTLTTTRNQQSINYWYLDVTWEDLGVPSGATVTDVRLNGSYYYAGLTDWLQVDSVTSGPYEIRTQDDITTIATMWSGSGAITTQGSGWVTVGAQTDQTVSATYEASTQAIRVRIGNSADLGNNASAAVSLHEDQIAITVTYTELVTHYGTITITGTGTIINVPSFNTTFATSTITGTGAIVNVPSFATTFSTSTITGTGAITNIPGTVIPGLPPYVLTYRRRIPRRRRLHP